MKKSFLLVLGLSASVFPATAQTLRVTNTIPKWAQNSVGLSSNVMAWMNQSLRSTSVTANTAFLDGERCGRRGAWIDHTPTNMVTIDPYTDLKPGEWMTAHFTSGIQGTNGTNLVAFQWSWHNAASGTVGKPQFLFRQRDTGFGAYAGATFSLADIDDDGDLDIFYYSLGETSIDKNNGAGIFSSYGAVDTRVTDTGDLDGDGDLDLIGGESTATNYYLNIYTNSGAGDFSEGWTCVITNIGRANIGVADVNGDGTPDLWVDGETFSCVYTNHGDARFSRGQTLTGTGIWDADSEDLMTDLNGDGSVDILRPYDGSYAQLWTNNGRGYFFLSSTNLDAAGRFEAGDFNNDGKVDVINWDMGSFSIFTNNGRAVFGLYVAQSFPQDTAYGNLGDMDGDGDLDIIAAGQGYMSSVYVLVNNGGSFSTVGSNSIPGNVWMAKVGDLDGDGTLDVMVYTAETSPRMIFLRNAYPSWTVEDGSGQVMTNAEAPSVARGTEFGSVPVGASITNSFTMRSTCKVDFDFTSALTRTNGAETSHFTHTVSSNAFEGTGGVVQVQVTFKPIYGGDHGGRLRLTDAAGQVFDIMLHGVCPGFVVTSAVPRNGSCSGAASTNLTAMFSDAIKPATLNSNRFFAWGNQSGMHKGSVSVNAATNQATLDPTADFRVGETVFGQLLPAITNVSGQQMAPFHWSFRVAASNATVGLLAVTGQRPGTNDARGAAFGDLNRDGWVDLFVAHFGRPCEVWTNNRAGVLCDSGQRLGTNRDHSCVSLGDANGDGYLDAFVGGWGQTNVVWTNSGTGRFGQQANAMPGITNLTQKIVPGDFDSDGDLDLFTLFDGQTNWIWLNNGGTFARLYPVGCHAGRDAAAGDLNGDGFLELLIVNHDADSEIWINQNGQGLFSPTTTVHAAGGQSCALGDVDNDGDVDIAIGDDSETTVYRNDGHGGFGETFPNTIPGSAPVLQFADLDGDRDLDLVRMRDDGGDSTVWLNNGAGTFAEVTYQPLGTWAAPKGADVGDLENDGDIDLVIAATNGCKVFLNNRPVMQVVGTNGQLIASGEEPSVEKGADFGTINWASLTNEFAITNASPVTLDVLSVTTSGAWSTQFRLVDTPAAVSAWSSAAFRVVFEPYVLGTQSAVFSFASAWTGSPFQLRVKGVYAPPFQVNNTIPGNASNSVRLTTALTATFSLPADPSTVNTNTFRVYSSFRGNLAGAVTVDGEGTEATFTPTESFLPGETIFAELTDGVKSDGGLSPLPPMVWSFNTEATKGAGVYVTRLVSTTDADQWPWGVELGDLDHDGDLDGVMSIQSVASNTLCIFLNDGAANFTNTGRRFLPSGSWESSMGLALGDLNRDGHLDIVLGHNDINCCVLWNDGHAQFTADTNALPLQAKGRSPVVGDLDGDGALDLLTIRESSPIVVWFNDGAGQFTNSSAGPVVEANVGRLADLDGDGDLDAVLGGNGSGGGYGCILMNNGQGGFTLNRNLSGCQAEAGDLDGDGDFDIISVNDCKLWINNGAGVFTETSIPSTPSSSFGLAIGDADADGDLDFMTGDNSSFPALFTNNGYAAFSNGPASSGTFPSYLVAMGDLDGNGSLDAFWEGGLEYTHHVMLNTFPVSIDAFAGSYGTIAPTGTVVVAFGSSTNFVVTADPYYWVHNLLTNGAGDPSATHTRIYTSRWNNVHADGTVSVAFAEALAALGTPEWWLAQYGWTNEFDYWETNDTDADSFQAREEQIAGTDPTNGASFFQCLELSAADFPMIGKLVRWNAVSGRVYSVDGSTNLPEGWFGLATNLPPVGVWTDTTHGAETLIHYRLGVEEP